MRILVIEDDRDLSGALREGLGERGHDVITAADGGQAWSALQGDPGSTPEVILLDLLMPGMDGRLFRTRQLADPRFAAIPTLVITGQPVDSETRDSMGRIPILPKPLDLGYLLAAIEEVSQPGHRMKRCGCGRAYDSEQWQKLTWLCEMDNGREIGERLELRQCACRSTLAWELGRHALSVRVPVARASSDTSPASERKNERKK